jgi:Sugar (and other) transporter
MSETHVSRGNSPIVRVAIASGIGTSIEWCDFILYGTAAALVLGPLFFSPKLSPPAAQLSAFATFWVGFAARPVGGVVFGHFGDRLGRKNMLILTLLIMGIGTFLVGCLPTYKNIGIIAPVLLVTLRQGINPHGFFGLSSVREQRSNAAWPRLSATRSGGGKARRRCIHACDPLLGGARPVDPLMPHAKGRMAHSLRSASWSRPTPASFDAAPLGTCPRGGGFS